MDIDRDIREVIKEVKAIPNKVKYGHFYKIKELNRLFLIGGLITLGYSRISILLLSIYTTINWLIIGHHALHGGINDGYHDRKLYAKGWRRYVDWFDWFFPPAWEHEHNNLHHMYLNEDKDPDLVENVVKYQGPVGKMVSLPFVILTWRWSYFALSNYGSLTGVNFYGDIKGIKIMDMISTAVGFVSQCIVPYGTMFVVIPYFAGSSWWYVLQNMIMAEVLSSIHTYCTVVTNHAGDDLYRFDTPPTCNGERRIRAILGSTNHTTGGFWNDFFHGYLNYQIEHHIQADLTPYEYTIMAPKIKVICKNYGVPYVQDNIFVRVKKTVYIALGWSSMLKFTGNIDMTKDWDPKCLTDQGDKKDC